MVGTPEENLSDSFPAEKLLTNYICFMEAPLYFSNCF